MEQLEFGPSEIYCEDPFGVELALLSLTVEEFSEIRHTSKVYRLQGPSCRAGIFAYLSQSRAMIEIPHDQLPPDTLKALMEEFASRDGTEFTALSTKVEQIHRQLRKGDIRIVFDPQSETCGLVTLADFKKNAAELERSQEE